MHPELNSVVGQLHFKGGKEKQTNKQTNRKRD